MGKYRPLTAIQTALRVGRLIQGLTLREVAEATGVPQSRLSAFEHGVGRPTAGEFASVWEFLTGQTGSGDRIR